MKIFDKIIFRKTHTLHYYSFHVFSARRNSALTASNCYLHTIYGSFLILVPKRIEECVPKQNRVTFKWNLRVLIIALRNRENVKKKIIKILINNDNGSV